MQFIDTHVHLQDYKTNNTQQIVLKLRSLGFVKVVCVSAKAQDFALVASLSESEKDLIIPAFGVHPWYLENLSGDWLDVLRQYLQKYKNAHIGESGVDRLHGGDMDKQIQILREQMKLADEFDRPINLHILRAEDAFLSLKKDWPERMVLHSFFGSKQFLEEMLKTKAFFALNPKMLNRSNTDELIKQIPIERLLTESDAPYQADFEDIATLIERLAVIYDIKKEKLAEIVADNFRRLCE